MRLISIRPFIVFFTVAGLAACSSTGRTRGDRQDETMGGGPHCMAAHEDSEAESDVAPGTPGAIMMKASEAFARAPGLNEQQKGKLAEIYRRTFSRSMAIRREMAELKSELFETLAEGKTGDAKIESLKSRLVALDQERLALMFRSLDEVRAVIGTGEDKKDIYRHLRDYEVPRGRLIGRQ